MPAGFELICSC